MPRTSDVLDRIRGALRSEPRLGPGDEFRLSIEHGALALDGEVASVAVKKRLLERAGAQGGFDGILDRLRVRPAQRMADDEVRDLVIRALTQEPALVETGLAAETKGACELVRSGADARGEILVKVVDGVVLLDGDVLTLAHKRLAGVLAWWVPGSRDVVNGLGVLAPERELDAEVTDAVRTVLEKDPFVDASQIRVMTHNRVVRLEGLVPTESEREMAEFDAWYVFGVDDVIDRIQIRP